MIKEDNCKIKKVSQITEIRVYDETMKGYIKIKDMSISVESLHDLYNTEPIQLNV